MKSAIKRSLFIAISLGLVALTARRVQKDREIEASLDKPDSTPPRLEKEPSQALPRPPSPPLSATTVTFSGTVVRNGPRFALRETAGILYPLDSAGRAWPFEGEDVRVTGKLDLSTRLLHVDAIESVML